MAVVFDPCFKLKYVRFCFGRLYDVEEAKNFKMKVKDKVVKIAIQLVKSYDFTSQCRLYVLNRS